ncbi:hypothetical protein [Desulfovibrio gilichinskyi]|uniref:Uncharacterized protein n=1 Tax=Desulfovibrio gilichinskyi TaxID=1519643 RepID=A0A1X7C235_9BACT|nr:hypothetical protein [Desulfovibrio gilichinskyi]SME88574.1 hypothetical protein SAMN06295933_0179 [Desulfovibrio gilichinskyi]
MIITTVFLIFATLITISLCKKISGNFDIKNELLVEKEKLLYSEQEDLRTQRRDLKRKLEELKRDAIEQSPEIEEPTKKSATQDLKTWLEKKQNIDPNQYSAASQFANEKNMNLLSALLTLNMINVQTYEEAQKLKLKL